MHRYHPFCLFLILLAAGSAGFGQGSFPYRLDSLTEAMLITGGSALMFNGAYGHNHKDAWPGQVLFTLDPSDVNPFDRPAIDNWDPSLNRLRERFEPGTTLLVLAGISLYGLDYRRDHRSWEALKTLSLMYIEGLYVCTGLMLVSKAVINRPRPYAYNAELSSFQRDRGSNNESYFSGNATVLFYNACFFSTLFSGLYPDSSLKPWVWTAGLGLAGFSALLSVQSGMHFPTDVITGALVGGLAGIAIPWLHRVKTREHLVVMPWVSQKAGGVGIRWSFR